MVALALISGTFVTTTNVDAASAATAAFKIKDKDCPEGWIKLPNNLNPQLGDCMANTIRVN